jgi:hypothetical protein
MIPVEEQEGGAEPRRPTDGFPAFGEPGAQLRRDHFVPTALSSFDTLEPVLRQRVIEPIVREKRLLSCARVDAVEERIDLELKAPPLSQYQDMISAEIGVKHCRSEQEVLGRAEIDFELLP